MVRFYLAVALNGLEKTVVLAGEGGSVAQFSARLTPWIFKIDGTIFTPHLHVLFAPSMGLFILSQQSKE